MASNNGIKIGGQKTVQTIVVPTDQLTNNGGTQGTPINIEVTIPDKNKSKPIIRRVGEEHIGSGTEVMFLSKAKNLTVFRDGDDYIIFRNYIFVTDNPVNADFLRNSPYFGYEIFENEYPPEILKEIEDRNKYLTRDPEEHEA